ncbi:MAG: helix-turn-helix domain-containing protein [Campylobacter sp.]|nr:helix-turn-helix domain-containing protein [Campylobacter sp.]
MIEYLLSKKGSFVKIDEIIDEVYDGELRNVDIRMKVAKIRQKTDESFILSKRTLGYKINVK